MKVKAINRSATEVGRERVSDLHKVHTNLDPALHPFEKAIEYTRALNAVKLDRYFALEIVCQTLLAKKFSAPGAVMTACFLQDLCKALHSRLPTYRRGLLPGAEPLAHQQPGMAFPWR